MDIPRSQLSRLFRLDVAARAGLQWLMTTLTLRGLLLSTSLAVFALWQVWTWIKTPPHSLWLWLLILPIVTAWILMVFRPVPGRWTLLAVCVLYIFLPVQTPILLQSMASLVLCAEGTVHRQRWLVIATVLSSFASFQHFDYQIESLISQLILSLITVGLSWAARVIVEERETAKENVRRIQEETEQRIAAAIHDTTARDLTRLVLRLQHWEESDTCDRQIIQQELQQEAAESLSRLRHLIRVLEGVQQGIDQEALTLKETLEQAHKHLTHANISLTTDIDPQLYNLPVENTLIVTETVAELLANAEKYAAPLSEVELSLNLEGQTVMLFQSNRIGQSPKTPDVSGGTGLQRLAYRLDNLGGNLETSTIGAMWLTEAQIPLIPDLEKLLKG